MREVFEKIGEELQRAGAIGMLPAGLVLTGGASQLAGTAALGREVLDMPVRVAGPSGVGGLTDHLLTPAYSTSIGLLLWGAQGGPRLRAAALRVGAGAGRRGPHAGVVRRGLVPVRPVKRPSSTVDTGGAARPVRPDRRVRPVRRRGGRRAADGVRAARHGRPA